MTFLFSVQFVSMSIFIFFLNYIFYLLYSYYLVEPYVILCDLILEQLISFNEISNDVDLTLNFIISDLSLLDLKYSIVFFIIAACFVLHKFIGSQLALTDLNQHNLNST